jgi:chromosome segregation ATPase
MLYSFHLQGFLRSLFIYCYFWKVTAMDEGADDLKKRLVEAEEENARLKEVVAKKEEDLQVLGQHSAVMEYEALDASKARDRAKAELARLSEKLEGLQSENAKLQEDHSILQAENVELQEDHFILKEDLGQLEEKHSEILEQLKESQASLERVVAGKVVAEEKFQHFNGLYKRMRLQLKEAKAKAADYLHQLSFASRV